MKVKFWSLPLLLCGAILGSFSQRAGAQATAVPPKANPTSDQLDIGNLEQKYWSAKDDDFTVVQNRTFTKSKRISLSYFTGTLINDGFIEGTPSALSLGYFFNERHGLSLDYTRYATKPNSVTSLFMKTYGTTPDHNRPASALTMTYWWSPVYAKVSLLERKILYLDLSFGAHVGSSQYNSANRYGDLVNSTLQYGIDVSQLWYINKYTAFRFDIRTNWSKQNQYSYNVDYNLPQNKNSADESLLRDNVWLIGINFFFGK